MTLADAPHQPDTPSQTDTPVRDAADARRRRRRRLALLVMAAVAVVAAATWFFVLRDQSDPPLSLTDSPGSGAIVEPADLVGSWEVIPGPGDDTTVAGYRIEEEFASGAGKKTATGRSEGVTGQLTVADEQVTAATITVDMRELSSHEPRRDAQLTRRGLETAVYPTATFELTEPIDLPTIRDGQVFRAPATGRLTLHGTTKEVTMELSAKVIGDAVVIQGSTPVSMADYDIESPGISGFVTVSDSGALEFLVNLERTNP